MSTTPLIAEDLLLLLFDPRSGTIAGEGTLFYTLAGAALADLAAGGHIEVDEDTTLTGRRVRAVAAAPPADDLLRQIWERLSRKPRTAQVLLAEIGPTLRDPLLDRLVLAGHIASERGRILGILPTTRLSAGGTSRRAELLDAVRPVLTEGAVPTPRTAALGALLSASGSLPALYQDIPWSGSVFTRGQELERGDWGAAAAGEAVTRTTMAAALSSVSAVIAVTHGN